MNRIPKDHWLLTRPIAHRGLFNNIDVPENSLPAFERCIEKNIPIELDVHLTKDGHLTIFHDHATKRMTGSHFKIIKSKFSRLSELKLLETLYKIPTLGQVLELVAGKVPILIEIKNEGRVGKLESKLDQLLRTYFGEFAIQSFNPKSLAWFKEYHPEILRGQLSSDFKGHKLAFHKKYIVKNLLLNTISKPDFINYDINALPSKKVTKLRNLGMPVLCWVIRSEEDRIKSDKNGDNYIYEEFER